MREYPARCCLVLLICAFGASGCGRVSDSVLIGRWRRAKPTTEITFMADHTFRLYLPGLKETSVGTWNLKNNVLTTIIRPKVPSIGEHGDGSMVEVHTIALEGSRLVMTPRGYNDRIFYDRLP